METAIKRLTENLIQAVKQDIKIYMLCPKCGKGDMKYGYKGVAGWVCLWRDCHYTTDKIPSIQEIKNLINLKKQLKQLKDWHI